MRPITETGCFGEELDNGEAKDRAMRSPEDRLEETLADFPDESRNCEDRDMVALEDCVSAGGDF